MRKLMQIQAVFPTTKKTHNHLKLRQNDPQNYLYRLKGGLHLHTTRSDGEATPMEVISRHQKLGYNFMAVSDHDLVLENSDAISIEVNSSKNKLNKNFFLIPSSEVSPACCQDVRVHINALNLQRSIRPVQKKSPREILLANIEAISNNHKDVIVQINHPGWSGLKLEMVYGVKGVSLIEIYNHTSNHFEHDEEFWDGLLSSGMKIWGVATDDSHKLSEIGGGWISVCVDEFSPENVLTALRAGHFYASNGLEFNKLIFKESSIEVTVDIEGSLGNQNNQGNQGNQGNQDSTLDPKYFQVRTMLIGEQGKILKEISNTSALFSIDEYKKREKYLRIKAVAPSGLCAWSNPVFFPN